MIKKVNIENNNSKHALLTPTNYFVSFSRKNIWNFSGLPFLKKQCLFWSKTLNYLFDFWLMLTRYFAV
jgi:hypothetical protein